MENHANVRVLIDYRPALRARTGVGEWVHCLVDALSKNKENQCDLTIFSSSWKDRLGATPANVSTIDRRIPVSILNYCWHRLEWPSIETVAAKTFDIVHSPHPLLIPSRRAAQILTIHDLDFLDYPEHTSAEVRRDYKLLVRSHAHRAAQIIVPSKHTGNEVERRLGVPSTLITLCPNGAPSWPRRTSWTHHGHILFVGTLSPRKNTGILIAAYETLLNRLGNLPQLVLAGGHTSESTKILTTIKRSPLKDRVRLTGYLSKKELHELYKKASVVVLPSLDEGFGLPALEAMTVGVPVVVANRGALPEIVEDAGLLFDPTSSVALAAALEKVLMNESIASRCINRGFERATAYSWKASAANLLAAYTKALKNENRNRRS